MTVRITITTIIGTVVIIYSPIYVRFQFDIQSENINSTRRVVRVPVNAGCSSLKYMNHIIPDTKIDVVVHLNCRSFDSSSRTT